MGRRTLNKADRQVRMVASTLPSASVSAWTSGVWRGGRAMLATLAFYAGVMGAAPLETARADGDMIFPMNEQAGRYWRFVTDGVMGGVSRGKVRFERDGEKSFVRMTGDVSTANNGGFIQMRASISFAGLPDDGARLSGIRLMTRGNGERYYIHIRTTDNRRPWHYYAGSFQTDADWSQVEIPFASFRHSNGMLPSIPSPQDMISLGIVAYGRDYKADISVSELAFY